MKSNDGLQRSVHFYIKFLSIVLQALQPRHRNVMFVIVDIVKVEYLRLYSGADPQNALSPRLSRTRGIRDKIYEPVCRNANEGTIESIVET